MLPGKPDTPSVPEVPEEENPRSSESEGDLEDLADMEEKVKRQREGLLAALQEGDLSSARTRVAYILNHFPETRDSDTKLYWRYWQVFQRDITGGHSAVSERDMLLLDSPTALTRARAKIQNEYKLYRASKDVQMFRAGKRQEFIDNTVEDRPGIPYVSIYCDETGKTQDFAAVGSVWIYNGFRSSKLQVEVLQWKAQQGISYEFHFQELTKHKVDRAREFVEMVLKQADFLGFKAVAVDQRGVTRDRQQVIFDLHYQLAHTGLEHEIQAGRLALPRVVNFLKDKEDGTDRLMIARLTQDLSSAFRNYFDDRVRLHDVKVLESDADMFIQLADLFSGAVNRMLNPSTTRNHKDEFAEWFLQTVGIRVTRDGIETLGRQDMATVILL